MADESYFGEGRALPVQHQSSAQDSYCVRIGMSVVDGEALAEILPRVPADVREQIHHQLWLRTVLIEQRRRVALAERARFDERADLALAALDAQEVE
jgi:hypothetical protein